jgi:hypothetical protein
MSTITEDPKPDRPAADPGHVIITLDFDMLTGVMEVRGQLGNPNFVLALIELARLNVEDFKRGMIGAEGPRIVPGAFVPRKPTQ